MNPAIERIDREINKNYKELLGCLIDSQKAFTVEDHLAATAGIECRKDQGVIDETPGAYKDIDAVMEAQKDLVEIVHTLRQVVCVKG